MNTESSQYSDPTAWVGRHEACADTVDPGHMKKMALALDTPAPGIGAEIPLLWQWGLFIKGQPYAELGEDGHPKRGGFLPAAPGRNRMWAGGRLRFLEPLRVGSPAERRSSIASVVEKDGRTGKLLFVTVLHEYLQDGLLCISEEQDIVYREPSPPKRMGTEPPPPSQWSEAVQPTPTMLFRYSAVTFNGHRIHYDHPYATQVEGYSGLVVHGPMIATLMCRAFRNAHPDKTVTAFAYRGLRPLIAPHTFQVAGRLTGPTSAELWAEQDGTLAHRAELTFQA